MFFNLSIFLTPKLSSIPLDMMTRGTHLPGRPGQPVFGCQLPCSEQHEKKEPQPFSSPIDKIICFGAVYNNQWVRTKIM